MVCDYWVLRRRRVQLSDLYHPGKNGLYYYWNGVNWRSFTAWVVGWYESIHQSSLGSY